MYDDERLRQPRQNNQGRAARTAGGVAVGLAALASGRVTSIPELLAGSLVSALPAMLVYLGFQRFLIQGLTMGIDR